MLLIDREIDVSILLPDNKINILHYEFCIQSSKGNHLEILFDLYQELQIF